VNWAQLSIVLGILGAVSGGAWKLGTAWTKKAMALGEKAEAERGKEREIAELRKSHEKFGERLEVIVKEVAGVAKGLEILTVRLDEREKARRDTQGIPVRSDAE
jgi:hypothetical protein